MKKKVFFAGLAAAALFLTSILGAAAQTAADFEYVRNTDDAGIRITNYKGTAAQVSIPASINGLPVTQLGGRLFAGNDTITSLAIPEGVTVIWNGDPMNGGICYGCVNLSSVILPATLREIGDYAFVYCTSLAAITIPPGVAYIGEGAFEGCALHYPRLSKEEFETISLQYDKILMEIARDRTIRINNTAEKNAFIEKYDYPANYHSRNAIDTLLEWYTNVPLSGVLDQVPKTNDEYMKARYIHDWIADNIEYEADRLHRIREYNDMLSSGRYSQAQLKSFYDRYIPHFTLNELLDRRKGVCMDYAVLFHYLAISSGLDAYYISDGTLNHAYNLLVIDNGAYIIDATWDAGHLNILEGFVRKFDKTWFLHRVKDNWIDR
ncbi:MAG: leucine-rich repeat protein [Treponema sp.]|jgi:hypothetical protein|nr:leucine-rich repeat protein [Treponema sp.]